MCAYDSSGQGRPAVVRTVEVLPQATSRSGPLGPIGPRCAFVLDSWPSVHLVAVTLLHISGFSVETFSSPAPALQRCSDRIPDVMVMEPRLPGMDALAVMQSLRALHSDAAPPVIWCTTVIPTAEQVVEGAQQGLCGVIAKPYRLAALSGLVLRVCRGAERERRLLTLGAPAEQMEARFLDSNATQLWVQVEVELAEASERPLSLVVLSADGIDVVGAVRRVVRAGDMLGRVPGHILLVLLPDVDESGATTVAGRIAWAVAPLDPRPVVGAVTRQPGERPADLLTRAIIQATPAKIG